MSTIGVPNRIANNTWLLPFCAILFLVPWAIRTQAVCRIGPAPRSFIACMFGYEWVVGAFMFTAVIAALFILQKSLVRLWYVYALIHIVGLLCLFGFADMSIHVGLAYAAALTLIAGYQTSQPKDIVLAPIGIVLVGTMVALMTMFIALASIAYDNPILIWLSYLPAKGVAASLLTTLPSSIGIIILNWKSGRHSPGLYVFATFGIIVGAVFEWITTWRFDML